MRLGNSRGKILRRLGEFEGNKDVRTGGGDAFWRKGPFPILGDLLPRLLPEWDLAPLRSLRCGSPQMLGARRDLRP